MKTPTSAAGRALAKRGHKPLKLTPRQISTILGALRYWQNQGLVKSENQPEEIYQIASNCDTECPLDDEEIDALCEKLNAPGP